MYGARARIRCASTTSAAAIHPGKSPVRSATRNSHNFAICTVLQIERARNVIVTRELAENAQLRRSPRRLVSADSVFPQDQTGDALAPKAVESLTTHFAVLSPQAIVTGDGSGRKYRRRDVGQRMAGPRSSIVHRRPSLVLQMYH